MDGFGFDIGGPRRGGHGGGHGHGGHRKHHHRHHFQDSGGGDFGPPSPPDDGSGDDGSGDDGGDMGHEGTCHCGGTCGSCQEQVGFTGHYGPDLYHDNSRAPMGQDEDDFGCDPLGSCTRRYGTGIAPLGSDPYGWEFDGPGSFGGELSKPILSNWGRYPSRSPLKGIFAGDLTKPILSNWGRYPSRSPITGIFGDDGDDSGVMTMPMDTITANPSSSGMSPDSNPSTSGLGGILDAVSTVAQGVSSVVAAARRPPPMPPPPLPYAGPSRAPVHHAHRRPLRPLPYFAAPPPYAPYYPPPPPPPMIPYRRPAGYPPGYTGGAVWIPSDPGY
jgi:hypothetical protein